MPNAACVGGLILATKRYIRLLNDGNYNQPANTDFKVGDIYDITFTDRTNLFPPHIEDVIVTSKTFIRRVDNMANFLAQLNVIDWNGHIDNLYSGLLSFTNSGTGYIPINSQMPIKSVGFWVADRDLIRVSFENKVRFRYPNGTNYRNISYVGFQETIAIIPAGTILRVSLSRLFPHENSGINAPRGYYLQLSGWYQTVQINNQEVRTNLDDKYDDLPF